jgi:hypothetical protein
MAVNSLTLYITKNKDQGLKLRGSGFKRILKIAFF